MRRAGGRGADPATRTGRPFELPASDAAARVVVPAYLDAHGPAGPAAFDAWLVRGGTRRVVLRRWFADPVEDGVIPPVTVHEALAAARARRGAPPRRDLPRVAARSPSGTTRPTGSSRPGAVHREETP